MKQPCLLQFALSKSFYSHAEGEYLEVVWVYNWVALQNEFVAQLQQHHYEGLTLKADIISGAVHETSYPIGVLQGMHWLYGIEK